MKKISQWILDRGFSILLFIGVIFYLVYYFSDLKQATLFLSGIIFLLGSFAVATGISIEVIKKKRSFLNTVIAYKWSLLTIIFCGSLIFWLTNLDFILAFVYGVALFAFLISLIVFLKRVLTDNKEIL